MAYNNNNNSSMTRSYAGRFVERQTKGGKNAGTNQEYISFTVINKQKKMGCTYRVYFNSDYEPTTGKKAGVRSCPVTATYFKLNDNRNNDLPIF